MKSDTNGAEEKALDKPTEEAIRNTLLRLLRLLARKLVSARQGASAENPGEE